MPRYSLEDIQPAYNVVLPNITITNGKNKAVRALNAQLNIKNRNEQAIKQSIAKLPKEKGLERVYPELALLSYGKVTGNIIDDIVGNAAGKAISKGFPYVNKIVSKHLNGETLNNAEDYILKFINAKGTKQNISKNVKDNINKVTVPRLQAQRRHWINPNDIQRQVDKILDEGYTSYPGKIFKLQGMNTTGGFYRPYNGHIAINNTLEDYNTLGHEIRHKIDDAIPLTATEERILNNSYGDDFIKSFASHKELKDYDGIGSEMVTTNRDARNILFNGRTDWTMHEQNDFIDKVPNSFIVNAIENSNAYGSHYINYLRDNGLLTKDKIKSFRESMKYVGGVLPFGIGLGTTKFNNNNSK